MKSFLNVCNRSFGKKCTHKYLHNLAYKLHLESVGKNVQIYPLSKIINPGCISIGNNVIIDDFTLINGGQNTNIGDHVHIASFVSITGGGKLKLEAFVGISSGCRVFTGNDDYSGGSLTGPTVPYPFREPIRSFIEIKKHAIIGANSVVLPGVIIGEGAIVGANSLVKTNLKPWTMYAGSPVKPIGIRRSDKISQLERKFIKHKN